jgi:hypothetical protein
MTSNQWSWQLVKVLAAVNLRIVGMAAEVAIVIGIVRGSKFPDTPDSFKTAFVVASVTSAFLMVLIAGRRAHKEISSHKGWPSSSCKQSVRYFVAKTMLRYTGLSHTVLNMPQDMFVAGNRLDSKELLSYPEMPLLAYMSRCEFNYSKNSGFVANIPKVLVEDCVMGALKLIFSWFEHRELTIELIIAAVLAAISVASGLSQVRNYVVALLAFDAELFDLSEHGNTFDAKGRLGSLPFQGFREFARGCPCLRQARDFRRHLDDKEHQSPCTSPHSRGSLLR